MLPVAAPTTAVQIWSNAMSCTLQESDRTRTRPGTAELNPLRFADMELVKELETNGFIDRIFGKKS